MTKEMKIEGKMLLLILDGKIVQQWDYTGAEDSFMGDIEWLESRGYKLI